jgi:hypothetical protein
MTSYLHPIAGAVVLALLLYAGALGLQLRRARHGRAELAARHARLGRLVYAGVLASWVAGAASTLWVRNDLAVAESLHFRIGSAMVLLLSASLWTSRAMQRGSAGAREIHPWLGAAALLLAAAHAVTGLRIAP